ncbi:MAG: DNA mismatch repair endonuclease MutL [Opitutae bacterium]|nr:DNA mismatch repair endonuclease MutL [Opitutae bacterium]
MAQIRVLPDRVANQIAAGEVIERPVAVVKELLENSLDAAATRVEIEFSNGGRSLVRIEDNGSGMRPDEALLAIERHATSKVREAEDLLNITTFGFRGEALPSIASVSRFQLKTRTPLSQSGTELLINGGKLIHVRDCGMPHGTRVEVAHLFNAVPARRKFLKADNTEAAHIIHLAKVYAIAHPQTGFSLIENGRMVFDSPACPSLEERVREIFGPVVVDGLMAVDEKDGDYRLRGLISRPGKGRSSRHDMITIVNKRPVTSSTLNQALIESYHSFLPRGRYPQAFLFLELDPKAVDVNVHPSKREVRFREAARLRGFVIRSLLQGIRSAAVPEVAGAGAGAGAVLPVAGEAGNAAPQPPFSAPKEGGRGRVEPDSPGYRREARSPTKAGATPDPDWNVKWRFLGHAQKGLAIFDAASGIILFDRRAAHQRILFEQLEKQYRESNVPAQQLLIPVPFELDALGSAALLDHLDFLNANGFTIAEFGRNFFRLEATPVWTSPEEGEALINDLVGLMKAGTISKNKPLEAFNQLARLACQRSVRLDDSVSEKEVIELANRLLRCKNPLLSPLGKPTYIELGRNELDRRFFRNSAPSGNLW